MNMKFAYAALLLCSAAAVRANTTLQQSQAATVYVTPTDLNGWAFQTSGDGALVSIVAGPDGNPCGPNSLELQVGANGDNDAEFRNSNYDGTRLADLTSLTYDIYVQHDGSGGQAPYIILNIDQDNNGTIDDLLFFEPVYQTGTYSGDTVPNQGVPVVGQWKEYDALVGGWWSLNANTFGPPLTTLTSYLALYPNAVIRNSTAGGVRIVAGGGAGAWDNFVGNADCFTIGVSGTETMFDFTLDVTPPTFVDVNGDEPGTTDIVNVTLGDGQSIQDKVDAAAAAATNHGSYVRAIAKLARMLLNDGIITAVQATEMTSGAGSSDIGKKK